MENFRWMFVLVLIFPPMAFVQAASPCTWHIESNQKIPIGNEAWTSVKVTEGCSVALFSHRNGSEFTRLFLQSTTEVFGKQVCLLHMYSHKDDMRLAVILREQGLSKVGPPYQRCLYENNAILLIYMIGVNKNGQVCLALRTHTPGTPVPSYNP